MLDSYEILLRSIQVTKDSLVTEEITYDLLSTLNRIEKGDIPLCDALKSSTHKEIRSIFFPLPYEEG